MEAYLNDRRRDNPIDLRNLAYYSGDKHLELEKREMTKEDLQAIRKVIGDMRFIQAAAVVASGLNETKQSIAYMRDLKRLDDLLEQEILK